MLMVRVGWLGPFNYHGVSASWGQPVSIQVTGCSHWWLQKMCRQPEVSPCTLTWVNQAGVTLILLVSAARDGITHHFLLSRADALNLIIFTTLPTHDIPLGSRAGFINDCVLWNRNQQAGTGKTQKCSTAKKQSCPTKVSSCLNKGGDHVDSSQASVSRVGGTYLQGCSKPSSGTQMKFFWNCYSFLFF